jgi:hypothetical protein
MTLLAGFAQDHLPLASGRNAPFATPAIARASGPPLMPGRACWRKGRRSPNARISGPSAFPCRPRAGGRRQRRRSRAERGRRPLVGETRLDAEAGPVVRAIASVAERSSSTGILRESCVANAIVRRETAPRTKQSRGRPQPAARNWTILSVRRRWRRRRGRFTPERAVWQRRARLLLGHGWSHPSTQPAGCCFSSISGVLSGPIEVAEFATPR